MHNDPFNHLHLLYLLPILDEIQKVIKHFESNDRSPTKHLNNLVELVESVDRWILMPTAKARANILTADNITSYLDYLQKEELQN